jgi:soluble lytic murein transglycosylase-like protein
MPRSRRPAARIGLAALALATLASAASADVIEIAPDGAVTTYSGPMVHTDAGAAAIALPAPPEAVPRLGAAADVRRELARAADRYALSRDLVEAVARQESGLRHDALSPKGAIGVMQLTPGTARELGVDPHDLGQNIAGGAAYLAQMLRRYDGDLRLGLAAYNAGPGAVDRYRGVPPYAETQRYVGAVLGRLGAGRR